MDTEMELARYKAEQTFKSAAGWFWWIGALSLLNSIFAMNGTRFSFTTGLGISQIGDALANAQSGLVSTLGFFISYGAALLFLLIAWLTRHMKAVLLIGVGLYAADALIFVFAQDWVGLGFHALAIFFIMTGWAGYKRAMAALPQPVASPDIAVVTPAPVPALGTDSTI